METSTKQIMKKTNNRQKSPKNSPSAYSSLFFLCRLRAKDPPVTAEEIGGKCS